MKLRTRTLAALSFALLAGGCGLFSDSGSKAPPPAFDPSTGALLVLYHVHLGGPGDDWADDNVYVDGVKVGRLNAGEELRLRIEPGIRELNIRPETHWFGFSRKEPLKYSLQAFKGTTNYLRYRTTIGQGRVAPITGTVYNDRELSLVSEREYDARN